jgi:DNA mismatch repair ATPase MutS
VPLDEVELFEIKRFLLQMEELRPLFAALQAEMGIKGVDFADTRPALELLDPEGTRVASFYLSSRYSPDLAAVRREKQALETALRQHTGDAAALLMQRQDISAREDRVERAVRAEISQNLGPWREPMLSACDAVGRLDITLRKAELAERYGGVMPEITTDILDFTGMTNPQLADRLAENGGAFTPVSLALARGTTVITGANMGGKSVALRALALNVFCAACGIFPFARAAKVCLFDSIQLLWAETEDSARGLSSFGGEIDRLNGALSAVDRGFSLIILDEFARGTNPDEGAAMARAVARYLDGQPCMCLMATHYDGVAAAASNHYQVVGLSALDLQALAAELSLHRESGPALIARHMNYGLFRVEGPQAMPRDALNICRLLGLRPEIMHLAEAALKRDYA